MGDHLTEKVIQLYNQNKPLYKIAREVGVTPGKVRRILITAGIELHGHPVTNKILAMYKQGYTPGQIARILGKSRNAVISHLPYSKGQLTRWSKEEREAVINGKEISSRSKTAVKIVRSRVKHNHTSDNKTKLAIIRKKEGLTQKELSNLANVPLQIIKDYERREADISKARIGILERLSDVLKCDWHEFIE